MKNQTWRKKKVNWGCILVGIVIFVLWSYIIYQFVNLIK